MKTANEKKATERRVLEFARRAGFPIPDGQLVEREKPDFQLNTNSGSLGIELTHVHPPPRNDTFNSPLAESALYEKAICLAERRYTQKSDALSVNVMAYPWDIERKSGNAEAMAQELVDFVCQHAHKATPVATFQLRAALPRGFGVVSIAAGSEPWSFGNAVIVTIEDIYKRLTKQIEEKNKRLPTYRANMPNSPIWLLLYCGGAASNGIELPYDFDQWSIASDFDRIFFFSGLMNGVFEIQTMPLRPNRL